MRLPAFIIFLFLFHPSSGQIFQKYYGHGYHNISNFYSVNQTADGGFILAGRSFEYASSEGALLTKTDAAGEIQWTKIYPEADIAYHATVTPDGGYILSGQPAHSTGIILIKTDPQGNVQGSKSYASPGYESVYSTIPLQDGGFMVFARQDSVNGSGPAKVLLMKLDSIGIIQWKKTYMTGTASYARSIVRTLDGGFAFVGISFNSINPNKAEVILVKTNANGITSWMKTFSGIQRITANSIIETSDSGFVISGNYYFSSLSSASDFFLIRTNQSGDTLWTRIYDINEIDDAIKATQAADGGFKICGQIQDSIQADRDISIIKTDPLGNIQWSHSYGSTYYDICNSFISTIDGGSALAGSSERFDSTGFNDRAYIIKTDADGFSGCADTPIVATANYFPITITQPGITVSNSVITAMNMNITINNADTSTGRICISTGIVERNFPALNIYPNPTTGLISVEINAPNCSFKLYGISGNLVLQGKEHSTLFYINISELKSGIYFLKLEVGMETTYKKIILTKP